MATQIIKDQSVYLGGYDITGRANSVSLDYSADVLDATVLGNASRVRLGGLKTIAAGVSGFVDADDTDKALFDTVGLSNVPLSFGADGDAHGSVAYTFLAAEADFKIGGAVGDMFKFEAGAQSSGLLVRGRTLLNSKGTPITATGAGTGLQLGALSASQRIYAAMHVLGAGTGSATCILQSNTTSTFSGGQTNRITFSAATGIGYQWQSVAGSITDTWWRISYTITGGAPSFKLVFVVGII